MCNTLNCVKPSLDYSEGQGSCEGSFSVKSVQLECVETVCTESVQRVCSDSVQIECAERVCKDSVQCAEIHLCLWRWSIQHLTFTSQLGLA